MGNWFTCCAGSLTPEQGELVIKPHKTEKPEMEVTDTKLPPKKNSHNT